MAKILIVDDSPATLGGLRETLENAGYEVLAADSFESGRRLAEEAAPDLLLVDIRLGVYNGLQILVRERATHSARPVIVMSGYPDSVLRADAERLGAVFVEKPIRPAELVAMIRTLLPETGVPATQDH